MTRQEKVFIYGSWILLVLVLGTWALYYVHVKKRISSRYRAGIHRAESLIASANPLKLKEIRDVLLKTAQTDPTRPRAWELLLLTEARWQALYGMPAGHWDVYLDQLRKTGSGYLDDPTYVEAMALHLLAGNASERLQSLYTIQKSLGFLNKNNELRTARALVLVELGRPGKALEELAGLSDPYASVVCGAAALCMGDTGILEKRCMPGMPAVFHSLIQECTAPKDAPPALRHFSAMCRGHLPDTGDTTPLYLLLYGVRQAVYLTNSPSRDTLRKALDYMQKVRKRVPALTRAMKRLEASILLASGEPGKALEALGSPKDRNSRTYRILAQAVLHPDMIKPAQIKASGAFSGLVSDLILAGHGTRILPLPRGHDLDGWLKSQKTKISSMSAAAGTLASYATARRILWTCMAAGRYTRQAKKLLKAVKPFSDRLGSSFLGSIIRGWTAWCRGDTDAARQATKEACEAGTKSQGGCPSPWAGPDLYDLYLRAWIDENSPPENSDEVMTWALDILPRLAPEDRLMHRARLACLQMLYFPGSADRISRSVLAPIRGSNPFAKSPAPPKSGLEMPLPRWVLEGLVPVMVAAGAFGRDGVPPLKSVLGMNLPELLTPEGIYTMSLYLARVGDFGAARAALKFLKSASQSLDPSFVDTVHRLEAKIALWEGRQDAWKLFAVLKNMDSETQRMYVSALALGGKCQKAMEIAGSKAKKSPIWALCAVKAAIRCQNREKALAYFELIPSRTTQAREGRALLMKKGWIQKR